MRFSAFGWELGGWLDLCVGAGCLLLLALAIFAIADWFRAVGRDQRDASKRKPGG